MSKYRVVRSSISDEFYTIETALRPREKGQRKLWREYDGHEESGADGRRYMFNKARELRGKDPGWDYRVVRVRTTKDVLKENE